MAAMKLIKLTKKTTPPSRRMHKYGSTKPSYLKLAKAATKKTPSAVKNKPVPSSTAAVSNAPNKNLNEYKKHLKLMINTKLLNHKSPNFKENVVKNMKNYRDLKNPNFVAYNSDATVNRVVAEIRREMPQNTLPVKITATSNPVMTKRLLKSRKKGGASKKTASNVAKPTTKYNRTPYLGNTKNNASPKNGFNKNNSNNNNGSGSNSNNNGSGSNSNNNGSNNNRAVPANVSVRRTMKKR
jgi:hypothetical protein